MRVLGRYFCGIFVRGLVRSWRICVGAGCLALPLTGWGHGALHELISELTAALDRNPNDARLHFELADAYCRHDEWEHALVELARVETLAPAQYPTELVRGQALLVGQKYAEALVALDHFISAHPRHAPALLARARAHGGLGRPEPCVADYEAAIHALPVPDPEVIAEVADFQVKFGLREEADRRLATAISQLGPDPGLLQRALTLELELGRFDDALLRVAALEKIAPRPESWMAQRAVILARAGRAAESQAAWKALVRHLDALPNLERGSPGMTLLAEQADKALSGPERTSRD